MTLIYFRSFLSVFYHKMTSPTLNSLVPVGVRGMTVLDRDKFLRNLQIPIIKVSEEKLSNITQLCKPYFLKLQHFKPVQNITNDKESFMKCVYLNPDLIKHWSDILEKDRESLAQHGVDEKNFDKENVVLSYENWTHETIFKAVLPENEVVSGFSQIGHIIHLNLRENLLDYRSLIGQVLLDKMKTCRTVVNKSNIIDNTYRNFSMEVIAGEDDFLVTVKENQCSFQFDFSKVYWNPRLSKEHERILSFLHPGDVLFDIFGGVGPFSIPAAKRKCNVFANDLNPDSFKWLNHNAKSNKVNMAFFKSYNQDGKDFICGVFKDYIIEYCKNNEIIDEKAKIHVTMNLPAMAVEFLKHFRGLITDETLYEKFKCEIIVYVYCFAIGDDPFTIAKQMVIDNIGCDISANILDVFDVRDVAPKKEMMRVTFRLTKEIIFDSKYKPDGIEEPPQKKICIVNNI